MTRVQLLPSGTNQVLWPDEVNKGLPEEPTGAEKQNFGHRDVYKMMARKESQLIYYLGLKSLPGTGTSSEKPPSAACLYNRMRF